MVAVREAGLEGNGRKEEGEISFRVAAALVHLKVRNVWCSCVFCCNIIII